MPAVAATNDPAMNKPVTLADAKSDLSALIWEAGEGAGSTTNCHGKPVARLTGSWHNSRSAR